MCFHALTAAEKYTDTGKYLQKLYKLEDQNLEQYLTQGGLTWVGKKEKWEKKPRKLAEWVSEQGRRE